MRTLQHAAQGARRSTSPQASRLQHGAAVGPRRRVRVGGHLHLVARVGGGGGGARVTVRLEQLGEV